MGSHGYTTITSIAIAQKGKMGTAQRCFDGNALRIGFGFNSLGATGQWTARVAGWWWRALDWVAGREPGDLQIMDFIVG